MKRQSFIFVITLAAALFAGCTHQQTMREKYPNFPNTQQIQLNNNVTVYKYTLPKVGVAHVEVFATDGTVVTGSCNRTNNTYSCTVDESPLSGKEIQSDLLIFD